MSSGPECTTVELPFIDQLIVIVRKLVAGNLDQPSAPERETFCEFLIKSDPRTTIARINMCDGKAWLDDAPTSQAVSALDRMTAPKLIEAHEQVNDLLMKRLAGERLPYGDQGRSRTAHYVDWERLENKALLVAEAAA